MLLGSTQIVVLSYVLLSLCDYDFDILQNPILNMI